MARRTPTVHTDTLGDPHLGAGRAIVVGTSAWYDWLAPASIVAFRGASGTFTARKERAGTRRGGWYWKAYRPRQGTHSSAYLGPSDALTLERLDAAAPTLARTEREAAARAPRPDLGAPAPSRLGDDPVLATKLHVPRPPPRLVRRPHLIARRQRALVCPLTLLAAPAGCGPWWPAPPRRTGPVLTRGACGVPTAWHEHPAAPGGANPQPPRRDPTLIRHPARGAILLTTWQRPDRRL